MDLYLYVSKEFRADNAGITSVKTEADHLAVMPRKLVMQLRLSVCQCISLRD